MGPLDLEDDLLWCGGIGKKDVPVKFSRCLLYSCVETVLVPGAHLVSCLGLQLHSPALDSNRIEVLKLLLVSFSQVRVISGFHFQHSLANKCCPPS